RLGFAIEPATWAAACAAAAGLGRLSAERVRDEWAKGLATALRVERFLRLWHDAGAARAWLPELAAPESSTAAALFAHDPGPPRGPVLLTALLGADPAGVLLRLRASNAEIARARAIAAGPAAPAGPAAAEVRRWLAATGDAADDLLAA